MYHRNAFQFYPIGEKSLGKVLINGLKKELQLQ